MAADALAYSVIVRELNSALKGGKITRIIQPEKDEIILTIYKDRKNFKLLLCTNSNVCRMHITEKTFSAPQTAPSFCMLLRKHLDNAVLNSVTQQPFERAADFCFTAFNDLGYTYLCHLIIELTGKSANLILTDENFKIFDSLKRAPLDSPGERRLLPGLTYSFLPSQNKIPPDDFVRLAALCAGTENPEYALNDNVMGVSRDTLHEIALSIPSSPSASDIQTAFSSFMKKLQNTTPNIVVDKQGNYLDVFPVVYASKNNRLEYFPSLNEAFDIFYNKKDLQQRYSEKARHINTVVKNALARTEKKIALQKEALLQSEKSCEMQDIGNIILSNLYRIRKGDTLLIAENYFTDNSEITILLDPLLSPQANAQSYFKKAAKLKKTADFTKTLLHENEETLNYLISVSESLRYCTDALRGYFLESGIRLLVQGESLTRTGLLKEFREDIDSVLFGTDSFWTGVDVPGEALSNVIVTKLPFAVPSHPVTAARMARIEAAGKSSFSEYSLPEAVLKFRQGVGRLIRSRTDRGIVVVLDRRLVGKNYGRLFLDSIPYRAEIV